MLLRVPKRVFTLQHDVLPAVRRSLGIYLPGPRLRFLDRLVLQHGAAFRGSHVQRDELWVCRPLPSPAKDNSQTQSRRAHAAQFNSWKEYVTVRVFRASLSPFYFLWLFCN